MDYGVYTSIAYNTLSTYLNYQKHEEQKKYL